MEIIVVATHNERFFDSFIDSLNKYNVKPTILGWNQKYTGHLMKDDLLEEYLTKKNQRRVILFCDAFDCLILRDPRDLLKEFLSLKKQMIISNENNYSYFFNNMQKLYFGSVNNELINTGMIIGYSDIFLKCLKIIKHYRQKNINSNQKIWTRAMRNNDFLKKTIYIDVNNKFFLNYNRHYNNYNKRVNIVKMKNDMFYDTEKKVYPFILQGNGNRNLNDICSKLGIKKSKIEKKEGLNYIKNLLFYYLLPFKNQILFLVIIIVIILIIKNQKLFKF